jgi:ADP-ribosylglycohydrolase
MTRPTDHTQRMQRARLSLEGLSVGDAFGERFFVSPETALSLIEQRTLPRAPWRWTDDTAMALSIVEVLDATGAIDCDRLAAAFVRRYAADPARGYGGGAHRILQSQMEGMPWTMAARSVFHGEGSKGNGGAMRVGPVGAYFADDLDRVVEEARRSARPTHAHIDGQAGAVAVAVAAAVACRMRDGTEPLEGRRFLEEALARTPEGPTADGLAKALNLPLSYDVRTAADVLGNGVQVCSHDTVPLALWCAARHPADYQAAMWTTVEALGDRDTTCAIVGSIVALVVGEPGLPADWRQAREPLA